MMRVVLGKIKHGRDLGHRHGQHIAVLQQNALGVCAAQQLGELGMHPLGGNGAQVFPALVYRLCRAGLQPHIQHRGKAQRAHKAQAVLVKAAGGLAHTAHKAILQILQAAEGVHHSHRRMIGHGIDRKIAAGQILF